jgi:hypothetical protein
MRKIKKKRRKPCPLTCPCLCHDMPGLPEHPNEACADFVRRTNPSQGLIAVAVAARELFEAKERDRHRVLGDLSGTDEQEAEVALLSALNDADYKPRAGH